MQRPLRQTQPHDAEQVTLGEQIFAALLFVGTAVLTLYVWWHK